MIDLLIFSYVDDILPAFYVCVLCECLLNTEARRGYRYPGTRVSTAMRVLGRSSTRATNIFNHWTSLLPLNNVLFIY